MCKLELIVLFIKRYEARVGDYVSLSLSHLAVSVSLKHFAAKKKGIPIHFTAYLVARTIFGISSQLYAEILHGGFLGSFFPSNSWINRLMTVLVANKTN